MDERPKLIAIVSASSGYGHIQASRTLESELKEQFPDFEIARFDLCDFGGAMLGRLVTTVWSYVSTHVGFRFIYSLLHKAVISNDWLSYAYSALYYKSGARIASACQGRDLVMLIAVHPAAACAINWARVDAGCLKVAVATDYVVHAMHALPNIDFVFGDSSSILASRSANAKQLSGRLIATGLPISSEFFRADGAPNECSLQSRVRVLATFGGEALTAERYVPRIFEAAKSNQKLEVVFLCGNNRALRKAIASKIQESAMGDRMSALSFRSNPAPLYAGADVLVGKAGGLTVAEAIASGNSIAVISHLPGQEEYNIRALEQAGKGRVVTADEDLASALITMASKRQPPECFVRGARAMATSMQKLVLQRAGIEARS